MLNCFVSVCRLISFIRLNLIHWIDSFSFFVAYSTMVICLLQLGFALFCPVGSPYRVLLLWLKMNPAQCNVFIQKNKITALCFCIHTGILPLYLCFNFLYIFKRSIYEALQETPHLV